MAKATPKQIRELANTIAQQADVLANPAARYSEEGLHSRAKLLLNNVQTLVEWTEPDA